ncbi:MAG: phosphotransferase [Microcella sp.]
MSPESPPAPGGAALGAGRIDWDARGTVTVTGPAGEAVAGDGVAAALAALASAGGTAGALVGRPAPHAPSAPGAEERAFAADIDMTSWALIVGDAQIVKVPRRLGAADRGARLQRIVAERAPDIVPPVIGTVEHASSGAVIAVVTELVFGASDGWTWAVDELADYLKGAREPLFPERLGALTARLHAALADATATATATAQGHSPATLGAAERASASAALDEVLTLGAGAEERPGAAARLAARAGALRALTASLPEPSGPRFALHGDLHAGQVLRAADGQLLVIDFDGDPQHPDDDAVGDAAVDVAHLQVSLDLVGAIVAKRHGGDEPRIADWCAGAQQRLLDAYLAEAPESRGVPLLDATRLPGLRAAQLIRELRYAREFLPRWAYAADWALTHRVPADPDLEDPPWTPPDFTTT